MPTASMIARVSTLGMAAMSFAVMSCAFWPAAASAQTFDKVSFGTNWVAEAEHGGFYQALADGTYKKYGLDVTIVPGGPQINNRILLAVGKLDFFMSANTLQSFDAVARNIPTLTVAAMFQKDPQVLIAHPDQGIDTFEDLKKLTLFISKEGLASYEGEVPNRAELDKAIDETVKKGTGKPGGFPYVDHAPTGRAKCMQCEEPIEKGSLRVAVEREIDTGAMVTRGAGYLHPKCVAENLENVGGSVDDLVEGLKKNSRIDQAELDAAVATISA